MAETKQRNKNPDSEFTTLTLPRSFMTKLRAVANHHDLTLPAALEKFGGPGIDRAYRKVAEDMNRDLGEAGA